MKCQIPTAHDLLVFYELNCLADFQVKNWLNKYKIQSFILTRFLCSSANLVACSWMLSWWDLQRKNRCLVFFNAHVWGDSFKKNLELNFFQFLRYWQKEKFLLRDIRGEAKISLFLISNVVIAQTWTLDGIQSSLRSRIFSFNF